MRRYLLFSFCFVLFTFNPAFKIAKNKHLCFCSLVTSVGVSGEGDVTFLDSLVFVYYDFYN